MPLINNLPKRSIDGMPAWVAVPQSLMYDIFNYMLDRIGLDDEGVDWLQQEFEDGSVDIDAGLVLGRIAADLTVEAQELGIEY